MWQGRNEEGKKVNESVVFVCCSSANKDRANEKAEKKQAEMKTQRRMKKIKTR